MTDPGNKLSDQQVSHLQKAANNLVADLIERAEIDSSGHRVVNVSDGVWRDFRDALDTVNQNTQEEIK